MKENMEELMLDLLCKKAVYGLEPGEERQLFELQKTAGPGFDAEPFELAAAAIGTVGLDTAAELPANLRSRIAAKAERFFNERDSAEAAAADGEAVFTPAKAGSTGFSLPSWLGWAVAAAACIVLAVNIFTTRSGDDRVAQNAPPPAISPADSEKSPREMRERLIGSAADLSRASLGAGNVRGLRPSGDIVWSDAKQAGYVRITGLPVNDAGKETYQLWIMAGNQDPKTPVDGGVFNVDSSGEVVIPIDPRVKVSEPKAFAITIEKPGGVVVSKQEKVAALAKVET
jgi:hypothetical protein